MVIRREAQIPSCGLFGGPGRQTELCELNEPPGRAKASIQIYRDGRIQVAPARAEEHVGQRKEREPRNQPNAHGISRGGHDGLNGALWCIGVISIR